jgi:hypothetical protein
MQAPYNPNQLDLPLEEPVLKLSGKMAVPDLEKQPEIQLSKLKLYIGDYWVDFPQSEYGGTWVVLARNKADCINVLYDSCTDCEVFGYELDIADVVENATVFDVVAEEGQFSKLISFFRT